MLSFSVDVVLCIEPGLLAIVCYWLRISCIWEGRCVMQASRVLNEGSKDNSPHKVPEVPEAFHLFCGTQWQTAYAVVFYVSFLSCSWVLAILFAHTMSSSMPFIYHPEESCVEHDGETVSAHCNTRYMLNIAILALCTTPLALMDVKEQWYVQNTLAFVRVCRMLLMCITPMLVGAIGDSPEMRHSFPGSFVTSSSSLSAGPPLMVGSLYGLSQVLSAAVFSQFLNGSIPIIIDSLKDRNNYIRVLNITFAVCFCLYVWLSIVVSTQFGSTTANPCNLNWAGYRWPTSAEDGEHSDTSCSTGSFCDLSAKLVEFVIVFCPAIDVVSAYPFISIILGNSLTEMVLGPNTEDNTTTTEEEAALLTNANVSSVTATATPSLSKASYKLWNQFFRFAMNITPMILAVTITNFSTVIQLTGAISVLICLVFPPLLSLKCNTYLSEKYADFSHHVLAASVHLSWIDGAYPLFSSSSSSSSLHSNSQVDKMKNYGAVLQADGSNNPRKTNGVVPFNSNEFIEQDSFKWAFLSVGIFITAVIFYISTR